MSSRFKVQKVSESDTGQDIPKASDSTNVKLLESATDSGSSTPTETKPFVPHANGNGQTIVNKPQTSEQKEGQSLLPDESAQADSNIEKPPPYDGKETTVQPDAQPEVGLVMKPVTPEKLEPVPAVSNAPEDKTTTEKGKSRFHVEFVDSKDDNETHSPPLSPNHDSMTNSMTNNTHSRTYYNRTFGHNTQEAVPMVAYYHNSSSVAGKKRPTLDELHDHKDEVESPVHEQRMELTAQPDPEAAIASASAPIKFGWIKGVLVRCLLNIWGVMLFLRMSWVVGQAGMGLSIVIVLLSALVTTITTLSMSAICTNGQVRGGGAYYLISRSLGPEFGGAIGLIFSLANAVGVAMYVVGFAETVVALMQEFGASMTQNVLHDTRIVGAITVLLLLGITQLGMAWEAKAQLVLLFILIVAIINFIVGTFIPVNMEDKSYGFFNYQGTIANENFMPDFQGEGFFSVFAIFFPAATGILAGCNISGDLKDAQKAIPKGTLLAILITSIVYCMVVVMIGCVEVRTASGNVTDFLGANITEVTNCTTAACQLGWDYKPVSNCGEEGVDCYPGGLLYDMQAMEKMSAFGPIITAGIFAATLSSALASLVSAPKIFQAVCKDKIFPGIAFFGKGAPGTDEPRRAYVLAFLIALGFILIGELNTIAPIISNFFLASYTLINYSCFAASLSKSPGWRPAFKFYNMWLSLFGALICCAIMFVIEWYTALITIVIVMALYKFVDYKKPDVNWGSSTQAYLYIQALNSALKLQSVEDHVKNFRPQTLVLTGQPSHRPALVHFASQFTKNVALMTCANIIEPRGKNPYRTFMKQGYASQHWLKQQRIKSFYNSLVAPSVKAGAASLMQGVGMGKLRANTILMGFKKDWREDAKEKLVEYIDIIHDAFDLNYGVCILRLKEGFDVSPYLKDSNTPELDHKISHPSSISLIPSASDMSAYSNSPQEGEKSLALGVVHEQPELQSEISEATPVPVNDLESKEGFNMKPLSQSVIRSSSEAMHMHRSGSKYLGNKDVNPQILKEMNRFQVKQDKGKTIDVWWLFDDGGLTILLPYLLSIKQQWSGCHLRVFTGGKQSRIDQEKRTMAQLLSKFRIDFKDVIVVPDINQKPKKSSISNFEELIKPFRMLDGEMSEEDRQIARTKEPWKITDDELEVLKEKTNRQIRLRELIQTHSMDAALVVMTLPMARKGTCSAGLYMSWLEELSRDMPPMLLMRGNQTSVLTFYS
ncbi:solute carrier family 12 member 1-like [Styela clava]